MSADRERDQQMDEMLEDEEHPRGTLFLMLVYLIAIVGMWGYVYVLMIQRGGTQ